MEARKARDLHTSTVVVVKGKNFFEEHLAEFIHNRRYGRIRNHVEGLVVQGTANPYCHRRDAAPQPELDWRPMVVNCGRLQNVSINMNNPQIIVPSPIESSVQQATIEEYLKSTMRATLNRMFVMVHNILIDGYGFRGLTTALGQASRDGVVEVSFPSSWQDEGGTMVVSMVSSNIIRSYLSTLMSARLRCSELERLRPKLWSRNAPATLFSGCGWRMERIR